VSTLRPSRSYLLASCSDERDCSDLAKEARLLVCAELFARDDS